AAGAAGLCAQVDRDLVHVGSGQIVDGDGVGATSGVDLDVLDAVEVHGDVADVAGEPRAAAVGRDVDLLVDVGAVELERVGGRLPVSLASPGCQTTVPSPAPSNATSLPVPPMTTSLPRLPVIISLPAPPLIVRLIWPGLSAEALMVSLPASPLMVSESLAPSAPAIVTFAANPLTTTDARLLATVMWSSPAVPLTVTLSAAPSPWPLPGVPARSMATCVTSVPVRSLTVMLSAPPRALIWRRSMPLRSMVMLPTSRV